MQLLPELLSHVFGFSALNPIVRVLRPFGCHHSVVLHEVLCCPHAFDLMADAFSVANPVELEALWSGGEFGLGSFHASISANPTNRRQIESCMGKLRQKVQPVTYPWVA